MSEYSFASNIAQISRLRIWRIGIPAPIWMELAPLIQDFVRKNKLQPIPREELFAAASLDAGAGGPTAGMEAKALIPRRDFPGGLRLAHLHMGGEVYRLDQPAWKGFSSQVLQSFRAKLAAAENVTFEQMIELSEATSTLG